MIFNRPDKRNAMSPQLHLDMDDALDELPIDAETEILVLTGAGEAFCAGQDIRLYFRGTEQDPKMRHKARRASNQWRWQKLSTFPKPTIAMVNGFCFGGAFTQVCACDFAIAADEATFGLSEVNWGILPGGIVSWNVVQMHELPRRHVLRDDRRHLRRQEGEGDRLRQQALSEGASCSEETIKFAKKLMEKSPAAVRYTKEAIRAVRFMNEPQAQDYLNCQERRAQVQGQGKRPPGGHAPVPRREDLSSGPRPVQAQEGGGEVRRRYAPRHKRVLAPSAVRSSYRAFLISLFRVTGLQDSPPAQNSSLRSVEVEVLKDFGTFGDCGHSSRRRCAPHQDEAYNA